MFDINVTVIVTANKVADTLDASKGHHRDRRAAKTNVGRSVPGREPRRDGLHAQRGYATTTVDFGSRRLRGHANGRPGETISFGLGTLLSGLFTGFFGVAATSMSSIFPPSEGPYDIPPWWQQLLHPIKLLARTLLLIFSFLRIDRGNRKRNISVACISDTHTLTTRNIPHADILIHAGDLTNAGDPTELQAQIDWLSSLPHKHKIVIAGNHDTWLDPSARQTLSPADQDAKVDWKDLIYLENSSVTLHLPSPRGAAVDKELAGEGSSSQRLKIWGSPNTPDVLGPEHAFQHHRGVDVWTNQIPDDVDIVVTHTPPRYHLDLPGVQAMGDEHLLKELSRVKPALHVFGHIHCGRSDVFALAHGGQEVVHWDGVEEHYQKAARSERWPFGILSNGMAMFHVWMLFFMGLWSIVKDWSGQERTKSTRMVNASMVYCNTGALGNEAQVVHL